MIDGKSRILNLANLSFVQLVDIEHIRQLLEAQYKITGILSAILDTDENILVAVGWQDICTRFHRAHPAACERCRESDAYIKAHLRDFNGGYLDYRCRNGLRDVAMPIIIGGEHLATFFTGQFFYDDDKPDVEFFRAQAREFGFDEDAYLAALSTVPICTREQIHNIMEYYRNLVRMMAEVGLKNLNLTREVKDRKKAEKSLQESRDYLDKIINSIADPIFVKDREHKFVLVNDSLCALVGSSRGEIAGRTDYDFFPREQVDVFLEKDEIVFETERENINEEEITDGQGDKRAIVTKKSLYRDRNGNKFIVGIIRDITELKQKEQELRTLNEELESRVAARTSELAALNSDLLKEIGERKRAEAEIKRRQRQLEELNDNLEKRVEEEVAKNREKDIILIQQNRQAALGEMLDHIAHQWKQPISTISLIVQDLEEASSCGDLTNEYCRDAVHKTLALLEHMAQTIDVFRDFYRPEKEKTIFRVKDSIDMAVGFIAPALRLHAIAVELDVDPGLLAVGFPKEYAQVLLNILGNARNALAEKKIEKPRVKLRAFAEDGKAVITIADNAGGIPDKNLNKIFKPYFTTRKIAGGTGIGLYMSKNIIEKSMGGTLSAANIDGGAQFRMEIPVS
jgi:PAS domain S-box-containing protein